MDSCKAHHCFIFQLGRVLCIRKMHAAVRPSHSVMDLMKAVTAMHVWESANFLLDPLPTQLNRSDLIQCYQAKQNTLAQ